MAVRTHAGCKAGITRTWKATARYLKGAPVSIVAPVHGVFRSMIALIETKNVCPLHPNELPDAVVAATKRKPARA
jgi:hypothetical protein